MSNLRRFNPEGRPVFITCVTYQREPTLLANRHDIFRAWRQTAPNAVSIVAWVLLPDHFHAVVEFGNHSMSDTIHRFKQKFSALYRMSHGLTSGRLWQHRFWDHIIRNEKDFNRRVAYIHFNPVKHGLVSDPFDWRWSSIRRWYNRGVDMVNWRATAINRGDDFGE